MFIDTHTHLYMEAFDSDREDLLTRASEAGIASVLHVGIDPATNKAALLLAKKYPETYASAGLHPHEAARFEETSEADWEDFYQDKKVVAVGEIGLDYFRSEASPEAQKKALSFFLRLARRRNLPAIIHCRDAFSDIIAIIRDEFQGKLKGVMHCFTGSPEVLEPLLEFGLYISFSAIVTYKKNDLLRECARQVPQERLLLETDCPYLPPQSRRGKRNEPAFLTETAQCLAQVRGVTVEMLAKSTTDNARRLFRL